MGFITNEWITIDEKFKGLMQHGNYEKIVLSIMNDSKEVFPNQYEHITSQGNGECDFVEKISHKKFDAKLPITENQGRLIGSKKGDLSKFYQSANEGLEEFGGYIQDKSTFKFDRLVLYRTMEKEIKKDKLDENIIFLFPYTVVMDLGPDSMAIFAQDLLSCFFDELKKKDIIGKREIYAIYPKKDKQLVLRRLNDDKREYVEDIYLGEYVSFDIEVVN